MARMLIVDDDPQIRGFGKRPPWYQALFGIAVFLLGFSALWAIAHFIILVARYWISEPPANT